MKEQRLNEFVSGTKHDAHGKIVAGESFGLAMHLVNLWKNRAFLIEVEKIIAEGYCPIEKPPKYKVDDESLNLREKMVAFAAKVFFRIFGTMKRPDATFLHLLSNIKKQ